MSRRGSMTKTKAATSPLRNKVAFVSLPPCVWKMVFQRAAALVWLTTSLGCGGDGIDGMNQSGVANAARADHLEDESHVFYIVNKVSRKCLSPKEDEHGRVQLEQQNCISRGSKTGVSKWHKWKRRRVDKQDPSKG